MLSSFSFARWPVFAAIICAELISSAEEAAPVALGIAPRKPPVHPLPKVRSRAAMESMLTPEDNSESFSYASRNAQLNEWLRPTVVA
jgi:hypothetical protein